MAGSSSKLQDAAAAGSRRKKPHEEHVNHEAWAIPYGDLITLLLAFFVVMYSMSSVNEGKYRALSDALNRAFKASPTTMEPIQLGKVARRGSRRDSGLMLSEPAGVMQMGGPHVPVSDRDTVVAMPQVAYLHSTRLAEVAGAAGFRELEAMAEEIRDSLAALIEEQQVSVRELPSGLEVEIKTDILFASGQAELDRRSLPVLSELARTLKKFRNPMQIHGYTDNLPISTARYPSNWELSASRAASVLALFAQAGVQPERMTILGHGEFKPVADNDSPEGRNANRRVVIFVRALGADELPANNFVGRPTGTVGG